MAVDYAHDRAGRPKGGSLTAYRNGRAVPPVPDGSCDLTAHVALDACAAAGEAAGATATVLTTQADALRGLGVDGARPTRDEAERPTRRATCAALARAGEVAELTDPAGWAASAGWCRRSGARCREGFEEPPDAGGYQGSRRPEGDPEVELRPGPPSGRAAAHARVRRVGALRLTGDGDAARHT